MKKTYYLPKDEMGRLLWIKNFAGKISVYAALLNVPATDVTSVQNDAAFLDYVLDMVNRYKENTNQRVTYKKLLMNGDSSNAPLGGVPANPTLAVAPTAVASGIFKRSSSLVRRIKSQNSYTEAIGKELGIIGMEDSTDLNTVKPILNIVMQAHHPNIKWTKQGLQGIRIYVDRTGTGYQFLAIDTVPNYLDKELLPEVGSSAVWKYRAIYILNDEEIGEFSDEISVTVSAMV